MTQTQSRIPALSFAAFATATLATFSVALMAFSPWANASENTPAKIRGTQIELFERDHTFAGSIAEHPVFGTLDESHGHARMEIRKDGAILELVLGRKDSARNNNEGNENRYSGEIREVTKTTSIELENLKRTGDKEIQLSLIINNQKILVKVSSTVFQHGHFHSPHFETTLNGQKVAFDFTGKACFGYSANLAMMILGAYSHLNN